MKTILVVDDESALAEALTSILEEEGYRVVMALNGQEGIDQERPDLVITDYMMPIVDGVELVHQVRMNPKLRDLPVVMMSAINRRVAFSRLSHPGSLRLAAFLDKPFHLDALLDVVEKLLGKACAGAKV